jgi:hypothetical protein
MESGFNLNEEAEDQNNPSARIDEVAKYLFEISDPILIDFLNGVFHLNLNREHTTVISCKNDYPNTDFSLKKADIVLKIIEQPTKVEKFQVEVQLNNDSQIEMRLFEYGYRIAGVTAAKNVDGVYELNFPRQVVIFIEENRKIGDSLMFRIITPDRQRVQYQIPVIRIWDYDIHSMIKDRVFLLLPFKIFRFRKILNSLSEAKRLTPEKKRSISDELMAELQILVYEINTLAQKGIIDDKGNFILISATNELINYLNQKFLPECRNEKKVEQMFVGVTEKAMQKGVLQGIQQGIQQGEQRRIEEKRLLVERLLIKKIGILPMDMCELIHQMDSAVLDMLSYELLDFQTVEDLRQFLNKMKLL